MDVSSVGLQRIKVIALAVEDPARASRFYGQTLGLAPAFENGVAVGYLLGDVVLMLKSEGCGRPGAETNPRITVGCADAHVTEYALRTRAVRIANAVQRHDGQFLVGAFLDSEGNRIWFCSAARPDAQSGGSDSTG